MTFYVYITALFTAL